MSLGNGNIHQQGDIPEIVKLPNNRIRVIRRFQKFTREDVDNVNLGSLMGDFGAVDTAGEQILNQGYTDCRLISVEVDNRFNSQANADNPVLVKTYETLTSSFVEVSSDTTEIGENNLKKITKVYRAVSGTEGSGVVGTTPLNPTAEPSDGIILATSSIEDNTAFAELTEVYLESGTLSETTDEVGPQKPKTIQTVGIDPEAPSGYVLAKKEESNFEGFKTNIFTFVKGNVVLSVTEDRVASQLSIINEVFNPTDEEFLGQDVKGNALVGYEEASRDKSDFAGKPTLRYRFVKKDVMLSQIEDKVGSQNAITEEWFHPSTFRYVKGGYRLGKKEESEVEGIPTQRFTFLRPCILSKSVEKQNNGKLTIETIESFFRTPSSSIGGTLIGEEESNVDGIKSKRFTFVKGLGQISVEKEPAPPQLAGCTYVTVKSYGTPVVPTGAPVFESETEGDGIIVYERTSLQGPITGIKQSYTDVVEVIDAGTVECASVSASAGDINGTIAVTKVTPPTTKKLAANVTVEIQTAPPKTTQLAYDLGGVSCSVASTAMTEDMRGADQFTTKSGRMRFSGQRKSADMSARVNTYPNSYLTVASSKGYFSYISSYENNEKNTRILSPKAQYSTTTTACVGTGTKSVSYQTKGIVKRESRPVLTDLNKVTYYEVITYSI